MNRYSLLLIFGEAVLVKVWHYTLKLLASGEHWYLLLTLKGRITQCIIICYTVTLEWGHVSYDSMPETVINILLPVLWMTAIWSHFMYSNIYPFMHWWWLKKWKGQFQWKEKNMKLQFHILLCSLPFPVRQVLHSLFKKQDEKLEIIVQLWIDGRYAAWITSFT